MEEFYLQKKQRVNLKSSNRVSRLDKGTRFCISYRDRKLHLTKLELENDDLQVMPAKSIARITRPSSFQHDPEQVARLAKALKALQPIRKRIAELRRRVSKKEFTRVKRRNTKWTHGWIRRKPTQLVRTQVPEQYSWELIWRRTERLTVYEYYKRLLELPSTSAKQRAELRAKIRWYDDRPSVRAALKPSKFWRSDPVWLKHQVIPKGGLGSYMAPVKEFKAFPIIDWKTVHQQWARRLASVRKELAVLNLRKRQLQDEVARLQPGCLDYNALIEEQDAQSVINGRDSVISLTGTPIRDFYPYLGGREYEISAGFTVNDDGDAIALVTDSQEEYWTWRDWGGYELPPHSAEREVHVQIQHRQEYPGYTLYSFPYPETAHLSVPKTLNLDDIKSMERDFSDARSLALASLRNLNLRRDEVEFNWFRSMGELKDTPATVQAGRSFFDFVKGATGRKYADVWTTGGHHHQLDLDSLTVAQRTVATRNLKTHTLAGVRLKESKALAAVGWKRVKLKTVSKATPLSILASVYLSWKFAIAPTIADIQTVVGQGREYVFAIRRGLGQLVRDHDVHFWASRSLRRQFTVTSMPMKGVNWRKPGRFVIDPRAPLAIDCSEKDTLELCPDEAAAIAATALGNFQAPFLDEQTGIRCYRFEKLGYWLPSLNPSDRGDYTLEEYYRIITNHNLLVREMMLEVCSPVICYAQHLSGVVFAKFKATDLEKALGMSQTTIKEALGLQVSGLNVYQTAWDLLPLSFVAEWFTNLRTCAQACNNVVNMALTGLSPSKAAWQTLATRVWASQPSSADVEVHEEATSDKFRYVVFFKYFNAGGRMYYYPIAGQRVLLETTLSREMHGIRDPKAGILHRTAVHRVVRKPVDRATPLIPKPRIRISITPPQAGSLAAMLLGTL